MFIPKCRRKKLYQQLRQHLGEVFRQLAQQKESQILEGHLVVDHVHMLISIPPKYAVAQVIGYIKGKSAIHIARTAAAAEELHGEHFWARGYFVSTVVEREDDPGIHPAQEEEDVGWTRSRCSLTPPQAAPNNPL